MRFYLPAPLCRRDCAKPTGFVSLMQLLFYDPQAYYTERGRSVTRSRTNMTMMPVACKAMQTQDLAQNVAQRVRIQWSDSSMQMHVLCACEPTVSKPRLAHAAVQCPILFVRSRDRLRQQKHALARSCADFDPAVLYEALEPVEHQSPTQSPSPKTSWGPVRPVTVRSGLTLLSSLTNAVTSNTIVLDTGRLCRGRHES